MIDRLTDRVLIAYSGRRAIKINPTSIKYGGAVFDIMTSNLELLINKNCSHRRHRLNSNCCSSTKRSLFTADAHIFSAACTDVTAMKSLLGVPPFRQRNATAKRLLQRNCRHLFVYLSRPDDYLLNKTIRSSYISLMM